MDSDEISNQIVDKEKALKMAEDHLSAVQLQILSLQKEIIEKQSSKKDLEIFAEKGKHVVKQLRLDISILNKQYWQNKNGVEVFKGDD